MGDSVNRAGAYISSAVEYSTVDRLRGCVGRLTWTDARQWTELAICAIAFGIAAPALDPGPLAYPGYRELGEGLVLMPDGSVTDVWALPHAVPEDELAFWSLMGTVSLAPAQGRSRCPGCWTDGRLYPEERAPALR
jgi:hypothetical protein